MIRMVVIDDHLPTRQEAIEHLTAGGLIKVVGEAATSDEGWKITEKLLPDIVLLDLHLPGLMTTFDMIKRMNGLRNCKVVIFASQGKASDVQDLLEAGACAYVLKTDGAALVRMTVLMVSRGNKGIISPSLPRHLTKLTTNERSILRHITQRGQIAKATQRLGLDEGAMNDIIAELIGKLELESPDQLVRWAKKHGF